ncbi:abc transporter, putative [Ricinus communis]|uniref:Abc transporter, putative n=1 Tax=Ricinus communis TaxID=3988 RepID=B9S649_RICCO|nr:abc transporter, putative [Ricinus communis]|eukprot:XP_002521468.1 ABC transporter B family member 26, chloroplastic [Ricinus communis]
MAISAVISLYHLSTTCTIRSNTSLSIWNPITHRLNFATEFQSKYQSPVTCRRIRYRGFKFPHSALDTNNSKNLKFLQNFRNWWYLSDSKEVESSSNGKNSMTVLEALLRMLKLIGNEKWIMFVAFGSLITAAISEITMPSILAESIFSAQNCHAMAFSRNAQLLGFLCLISGISSGLRSVSFAVANIILVKRLRETLYSALIFQDINFFDSEEVGGLTSRLGSDCQRLSHVIGNDIHLIVRNVLQGTGAMINLLCLSWPLALSSILICCLLAATFLVYGWYQKKAAKLTQDFTAHANEAAEETLSLIRTVRVYGTERKEFRRYKHWLQKLAFISYRESAAYGLWTMIFHGLYRATQVFAVLLGGMSVMSGHVSTEQLTKYILYCEWLIYATWRVVDNISSLLQAIGASEKVFQLMQLSPSSQFLSKGEKLPRLMGQVHFVDVTFHYPSRPTVPILEHIHLLLEANEVVALVGLSGSGKTTLVNLLLRLYEPSNGQIYIDGFPLRELDMRCLKENIGYVEQEPQLFRTDIKSNITYGCYRDVKMEDIEYAAKLADAHEFISSLPFGYETLVDNELLSGGQKQRIAFARAILRNPAILILDEATSALDSESEHYIKGILYAFKTDEKTKRTVIVITHRLSTIKTADRIIVMDGGRVVEVGNHVKLQLQDGLYSQLIKLQEGVLT